MQPLRYNLCSSDQRLEPVRIQTLRRTASLMPSPPPSLLFLYFSLVHKQWCQVLSCCQLNHSLSRIGLISSLFFIYFFFKLSLKSKTAVFCVTIPHAGNISSLIHWWMTFTIRLGNQVCDAVVPPSVLQSSSLLLTLPEWHHASLQAATGRNWPEFSPELFWTDVSPNLTSELCMSF